MAIPSWLVPWWDWWARSFDLLDWEALSAVATAFAVILALEQANRSARVQARYGTGVLTSLIGLLEPLAELLHVDPTTGAFERDGAIAVVNDRMIERARAGLDRLQHQDTATLGIADYLTALPIALDSIAEGLSTLSPGRRPDLEASVDYLAEAVDEFRYRRSVLSRGRLATGLTALFARFRSGLRRGL